jgi:ADP-heptose:LPS heptosyltransferase
MNIVSFSDAIELRFTRSIGSFNYSIPPYVPYVFARPQYGALSLPQVQSKVFRTSSLTPRLKAFNINGVVPTQTLKQTRLLLYNGSGGYGDQILTWPISKILTDYGFEVYILADPGNDVCWHLFPWVKGIYTLPIQYETLKLFECHAFHEIVVNTDDHPDQLHPVDTMLHHMGFNHDNITPERKVVKPYFSAAELDEAATLFKDHDIAIFQLHSGSATRSLLPAESAHILRELATRFTKLTWVALYDNLAGEPYKKAVTKDQPANVELFRTPKLRLIWAITQRAKVVIAPDSMMVHVAGSLGVPCIGLWGLTDPALRTKYYTNHFPIWKKTACNFSPCHSYLPNFPHFCPPVPDKVRTQCEVLTAITVDDIVGCIGAWDQVT